MISIFLMGFHCRSIAESLSTDTETEKASLSLNYEIDFVSQYVWRGLSLSKGAVMEPSVSVSAHDFTFTLWGNIDFNSSNLSQSVQWNEIDLILTYSQEWGKLTIEPGIQYWFYPNQPDTPDTGEISLKLTYPIGPMNLVSTHNFDIAEYKGSYYGEGGIDFEHKLNSNFTLAGILKLAWGSSRYNQAYLDQSKWALEGVIGELSLTYQPKDHFYIRPHIGISHLLDSDLQNKVNDPTLEYAGIAIGMDF